MSQRSRRAAGERPPAWLHFKVLLFAAAHLLVHVGLFLITFSDSMGRFDTGEPASASMRFADTLVSTLSFPVVTVALQLPSAWLPSLLGYLPFLLNSLCWGIAAAFLFRLLRPNPPARPHLTRIGDP